MLDAGISQLVSNIQHPCHSEDYLVSSIQLIKLITLSLLKPIGILLGLNHSVTIGIPHGKHAFGHFAFFQLLTTVIIPLGEVSRIDKLLIGLSKA